MCDMNGQEVSVRKDGFIKAGIGEVVQLAWNASNEHQFEEKTGRRRESASDAEKQSATVCNCNCDQQQRGKHQNTGDEMSLFGKTILVAAFAAFFAIPRPAVAVDLTMYYPVAVGGPVTKIIDDMVDQWTTSSPTRRG